MCYDKNYNRRVFKNILKPTKFNIQCRFVEYSITRLQLCSLNVYRIYRSITIGSKVHRSKLTPWVIPVH